VESIKVYRIRVNGEIHIKAKNSTDAVNKAKEYYEGNIKQLDFSWVEYSVLVEEEE